MWRRFPFGLLKYSLQKEVTPMPIYRHHLQNRRLWVQVLVPLPKILNAKAFRIFTYYLFPIHFSLTRIQNFWKVISNSEQLRSKERMVH